MAATGGGGAAETPQQLNAAGVQALGSGGQWTVRLTEIDLNGLRATTGTSDTLTATSAQDPAVTTAQTISCGERTIDQDGVQEP